jgi:hypothetical protein
LGVTTAQAQFSYTPARAQNVTGTYTDLGTTGTVIATGNTDDDNSAAQEIGFTFKFNGGDFTQFVLNTNGYLKLGSTAPAAPYYYAGAQDPTGGPLNSATETNLILPFNLDLVSGSSAAEYRVVTSGSSPNRVCTIQWKNVSDKARDGVASQYDNFSFQVKLYETTNNVEFVYNTPTAVAASADAFKLAAVGIKGSGTSTAQSVVMQKGSMGAWSTAVAVAGNYPAPTATTVAAHGVRKSVLPDAGRTYRFFPAFANDASVSAVYTLGKLPIPYGTPHVIRAFVRNMGTNALTNVNVTVTVSGANSFTNTKTIPTFAAGTAGTLSFDAFTPTAPGTNNVTVTIANDDDNSNNTATYTQQITTNTYSYADPTQPPTNSVGLGTNAGILATKYTTGTALTVTSSTARLEDPNSVGKTIYAVVCDNAGTIIGRTPNYVVTAADISTFKAFTFSSPVSIATGEFYTGIAQTANATAYFPIGVQTENPTRSGAYYVLDLAGGQPGDVAGNNLGRLMIDATIGAPPTCPPPSAVSVNNTTSTSVQVNFTAPANGTGYTIIYGPTGFDPATAGTSVTATGSPFTITGLSPSTTYTLYIRANCGASDQSGLTGAVAFTTLCTPPIITNFPYSESFDNLTAGATLPCGITVTDVNNDNNTWAVVSSTNNSATPPNVMRYSFNTTNPNIAGDDWFFTPALFLRAGSRYQLSFKYKTLADASGATSEKLEVKYGTAATPASQTNLLWKNENITNTSFVTATAGTAADQVLPISPMANGNVYLGFHVYSAGDQFSLYVDDISITSVVTGLSDALMRSVNVFPNPSAGEFTVEVRGAKAKGAMKVEVTNLLGQRVHTSAIRDNFENKINLSGLANGMYTLKVISGNDYMIRNIVVQK